MKYEQLPPLTILKEEAMWVPDEPGQLILLQAAAHMHYWLYPFFREGEKRRLWFVDADSTLGPTLASGESEIPIFKLWKKKLFLANLDFLPLPPNAQTTSTRRRGIAPVIAMSRLGDSSRPLHDPASRHRISDPRFFYFYQWVPVNCFNQLITHARSQDLGFRTSTRGFRTWISGPGFQDLESSPSYGRLIFFPSLFSASIVTFLFPVTFLCVQWSRTDAHTDYEEEEESERRTGLCILIHRQDRFCHRKCRPVLPVN